ncbi:MAG: penicillin-binding protein 1C [Beijerinckiaceae bacterium]|nr:penicillin-binding protein 1C [Beijerinckiaceae bacterium]MCI0737077.1 penicillin-binding protein 1C [Beijerinckiaceae bacterium]
MFHVKHFGPGAGIFLTSVVLGLAAAFVHFPPLSSPVDLAATSQGSHIVVDRNGVLLRAFTAQDGRWRLPVRTGDVDPRFLAMLIAYEDRRFYAHYGVDLPSLGRATLQWAWHGQIISGGSTLTMQVARLLSPRAEKSLGTKFEQILRALKLERQVSKAGILDLYIAVAPYGGNIEGARAASLAYFGHEPKRLSIAEAALLVAMPQSPETRRPDRNSEAARVARDMVLDRAFDRAVISGAERDAAKRENVPRARRAFPMLAAHASEAEVRRAPRQRLHSLTLDAKLQASLEILARESAAAIGPKLSCAILAIDNASGEIRAHIGSADYFAQERAGAIDMTRAIRSPGSALKPFIYALAFDNGLAHPETLLDDRPRHYGGYAPENFDLSFQGTVTARRALQLSLNVPAVSLLDEIGPAQFLAHLRGAGANIVLPDEMAPGLATGLGGIGTSLRDLAALYAGLARGGDVPALIETAQDTAPADTGGRRIAGPVASWYAADILRGAPPPQNAPFGRIAYKTGTSYGYRDAFAIGFDKAHTIAVWLGRPDNASVPGLIGRQAAAPVLFDAFARLGGAHEFLTPPAGIIVSRTVSLPPPLRHLRKDAPKTLAAAANAQLRIAYPPQGARVDLGLTKIAAEKSTPDARLTLKAEGGLLPLRWIINGVPLGELDMRRQAAWAPDGAGFARVYVMDAKGSTDSVVVRLE